MYDVLIVGGGAASLSATLMLGRVHRDVLVIDAGRPRNAPAHHMHNVLTRDGTPPQDFIALAHDELSAYGGASIERGEVTHLARTSTSFEADLADGRMVAAKRILLATGLVDSLPAIPGVRELWGRSVLHCPYCHGWEVSGRTVAVQGAGPARVRLALQLSRFADDVVLCTAGSPLADSDRDALRSAGVGVQEEAIKRLEPVDSTLHAIVFDDGSVVPRDALFVEGSTRQRSGLAESLGCDLLPDGGIEIDEFGRTSVPGVYAAGDAAHRPSLPMPLASVTSASAAGQAAAGAIDQDLLSDEFGLANPLDALLAR